MALEPRTWLQFNCAPSAVAHAQGIPKQLDAIDGIYRGGEAEWNESLSLSLSERQISVSCGTLHLHLLPSPPLPPPCNSTGDHVTYPVYPTGAVPKAPATNKCECRECQECCGSEAWLGRGSLRPPRCAWRGAGSSILLSFAVCPR